MKRDHFDVVVQIADTDTIFNSSTPQLTLNPGEVVTFRGSPDGERDFRILSAGWVNRGGNDGYHAVLAEPYQPTPEERFAEAERKAAKRKLEDDAIYGNS